MIIIAITSLIMLITTIALYDCLNKSKVTSWIIWIVDKSFLFQMLFNFGVSAIIMMFTGSGFYAGVSNLLASILFPIFLRLRQNYGWKLRF